MRTPLAIVLIALVAVAAWLLHDRWGDLWRPDSALSPLATEEAPGAGSATPLAGAGQAAGRSENDTGSPPDGALGRAGADGEARGAPRAHEAGQGAATSGGVPAREEASSQPAAAPTASASAARQDTRGGVLGLIAEEGVSSARDAGGGSDGPRLPDLSAGLASAGTPRAIDTPTGLEREASAYLADLTAVDPEPVPVTGADHFVQASQPLSLLGPGIVQRATRAEILADPELEPDTPITVVREMEQVEVVTPERLIAESAGNLERSVRIVVDGEVRERTVREVLETYAGEPEAAISVLRKTRFFEITTPRELGQAEPLGPGELIGVIKEPYPLETATVADLLLDRQALEPDSIFYVRTVREEDVQGIWGIVQSGLVDNFARGIAIRRGEGIDTYRVEIPPYADEVLPNRSSSFLGRLIHEKSLDSYVYNFRLNRMGRNPDLIYPGQEIVIVQFAPEELVAIYRHFVESQASEPRELEPPVGAARAAPAQG